MSYDQTRRRHDVLQKTSDLQRLEDVRFTTSWRRLIYVTLKTSDLWRLEDVSLTTSWKRLICNVLKTLVKQCLCSNVVATLMQRQKVWLFLSYSENLKRFCLGQYLGMKFFKLFRYFNHTLQSQKRRNTHVYVRSSHRRFSVKKVFLRISLISQENTWVGVFF